LTRKTNLTRKQCAEICRAYFKGRKNTYQRGAMSIRQLAFVYNVSHDTIRRIVRGQYLINGKVNKVCDYGFSKRQASKK